MKKVLFIRRRRRRMGGRLVFVLVLEGADLRLGTGALVLNGDNLELANG